MTTKVTERLRETETKVENIREEARPRCIHYWIIETAHGPTSMGVCKYCGEEREFANYQVDFFWEDSTSSVTGSLDVAEAVPGDEHSTN